MAVLPDLIRRTEQMNDATPVGASGAASSSVCSCNLQTLLLCVRALLHTRYQFVAGIVTYHGLNGVVTNHLRFGIPASFA